MTDNQQGFSPQIERRRRLNEIATAIVPARQRELQAQLIREDNAKRQQRGKK